MNSFNRGFIFGTGQHGYSYTDMILQTINQYPELSNKFPMLEQLREANLVNRKEKVLEMINQRDVTGDLANDYNRQLRSLSNPSISKTDNIKNDIAISEIFSLFSLMMTYQHGVGFSRFSFNNVIDPKQYIEHINTAKDNFLKSFNKEKKPGELTELEKIQKRFMRDNMFQNYLVKSDEEIAGILDESNLRLTEKLAEKLAVNITEEDAQSAAEGITLEDIDTSPEANQDPLGRAKAAQNASQIAEIERRRADEIELLENMDASEEANYGINSEEARQKAIEEVNARYDAELRAIDPKGPDNNPGNDYPIDRTPPNC